MKPSPFHLRAPLAALTVSVLGLCACSPAYVLRAGYEEAKILWRRQPIERVLQRSDLDGATRSKLELTLAVRAFARDALHLRAGDSYATFARVDAHQIVHVVSAAYRLRLEPYTWWFPIVGRVPYKGYFSAARARHEAECLERQGLDADVRPSVAFSTLGWFADPLLSSLLRYDRSTLAEIIIHELLHNTSHLGGHANFDESFATFVGHRGAIMFFTASGDAAATQRATDVWGDALQFSDFIHGFVSRLRAFYAGGGTAGEREHRFMEGQRQFRQLTFRTATYQDFGTTTLNNAVILQYFMYADRLRLFEDLFHEQHDNLARTIAVVLKAVHAEPDDPFRAVRRQLQPQPAPPDLVDSRRSAPVVYGSMVASCLMP